MTRIEMSNVMQKYWGIIRVPHDERTKGFLSQCHLEGVTAGGKSYKYYQRGDGPVVVLVHGLHSNLGSMVPVANDLVAHGFKAVLFDAPAHGESVGSTTDPVEVREVIRQISQRLGELHGIVCHSLGGVWALCAWNSDFRAKTLVSIASPSNFRFLVEKFVQLHKLGNDVSGSIVEELESRFGKTVWVEFAPSEIVKTISVPGLIIHGKKDDFVPPAHAEQLHANWTQAKVELFEGLGHFDVIGSGKVRGLVTRYLAEVS